MSQLRRWFAGLPVPVRVVAGVGFWPLLLAVRMIGQQRGGALRFLGAALLVLLVLPVGALVLVPRSAGVPASDAVTSSDANGPGIPTDAVDTEADAAAPEEDGWLAYNVVDGDTVDVRARDGSEERIRIIGIDTPERGECGFATATAAMEALVLREQVVLVGGARDERDRYGRLLRYVEVDEIDVGLALIEQGLAIARYDGRDGYGRHPRQDAYVIADTATEHLCGVSHPAV